MADDSIAKRFAEFSDDDLARLLQELEKAEDDTRLRNVLVEIRRELARRSRLD